MFKQRASRLIRTLKLLPLAEQARYCVQRLRSFPRNRRFRREHPDFKVPPAALLYETTSVVNYQGYYQRGRAVAEYFAGIMKQFLPEGLGRVCEWGCGVARIIRHMGDFLGDGAELSGTDYNERMIKWDRRNIPQARFSINGLTPPLPFAEGAFDCLYSYSVLTHLSEEMHHAWLKELARVVRPGGIIMVTTHGDQVRGKLLGDEAAAYDAGRLVLRGGVQEGSRMCVAFHSPAFMRAFLKDFQVLLHTPGPNPTGPQDLWVVRKP